MKKRIIIISILAILLITSVSFISAEDVTSNSPIKTIPVKVVWNGDSQNVPDHVVVKLIKDGSVVDNVSLSKENSWKSKFHVDEDGSYSVQMDNASKYSISVSGDADNGYVITAKVASSGLGLTDDSQDSSAGNITGIVGDVNKTSNDTDNNTSNDTNKTEPAPADNNKTSNDTNKTEPAPVDNNKTSNDKNNTTPVPVDDNKNNNTLNKTKTIDKKTQTTNITKETKVIKEPAKNNTNNTTAHPMKQTGFPVILLIGAVGMIALAPIIRKKE